jgi:hypothetical protein
MPGDDIKTPNTAAGPSGSSERPRTARFDLLSAPYAPRGLRRGFWTAPRVSVLIKRFLASKCDLPLGGRLRGRPAFA